MMRLLALTVSVVACSPVWCARPTRHCKKPEISDEVSLLQDRVALLSHPKRHPRRLPVEDIFQGVSEGSKLKSWHPLQPDHKLKVVYGVFTSPLQKYAEQLAAVEDTWAKEVTPQTLLVVGVNGSNPHITYRPAPQCKDGHVNNAGISCKEATLLTSGYELGADWVVVVGSDNYVLPKNMEERLATEDAEKAQILGIFGCGEGKYCEDHKSGICGGGGYAISRAALYAMVGQREGASQSFIEESMHTARTVGGYWSDQVTSCIARRHDVSEVQLAGLYGWKLGGDVNCMTGCALDEKAYRQKIKSTDPKALIFHYIAPSDMRLLHKMVKRIGTKDIVKKRKQVSLLEFASHIARDRKQREAYIRNVDHERASLQ